jgi:1,4-dihydroxy-2-naphthoate octaprenyltransferase
LGDVFVLAFFGLGATVGTVWVLSTRAPLEAWLAGTAVGALATAILVVNNLRDRVGDARVGKRTLAVRFGARFARNQYAVLVGSAFALCLVCAALAGWGRLLPLLAAPLALKAVRALRTTDGAALNPWLGATARLDLVFGLLYCAGVALQAGLS